MSETNRLKLSEDLRGRNINNKVIPTVCNVNNMLKKLVKVNGDYSQLKQWEKRSYMAYLIDEVKFRILSEPCYTWRSILRELILSRRTSDFGASVIDIYLVAYVAETIGPGREQFFNYIYNKGISQKENSANAIWQVGKGDGVFLGILNDDGTVKDWGFMKKWIVG